MLFSRVPLAWLNLTHDKRRLVIRVLGVTFAVFLMFAELGFWDALLDAPVELIKKFNGEVIVVSKARYAMAIKETFTRHRLSQALTIPAVQAVYPLYLEYTHSWWKDTDAPETRRPSSRPIRVIAFDPDLPVLTDQDVCSQCPRLKILYNVLLDRRSKKKEYGPSEKGVNRELADHTVHIAGTFGLGTDFTSGGSVVMSDATYAQLFPDELAPSSTLRLADVGIIKLKEGYDADKVRDELDDLLPDDVNVYTRDQFIEREKNYWRKATPMGFIFQMGLWMGFIVGAVICYQIISTDVSENLAEYATLKAIGHRDSYLNWTVLREALWLAVLGFVPGWGLSALLYSALNTWEGLPMRWTILRVLLVFGLTATMCILSGLLALRKVKNADPAEVFG